MYWVILQKTIKIDENLIHCHLLSPKNQKSNSEELLTNIKQRIVTKMKPCWSRIQSITGFIIMCEAELHKDTNTKRDQHTYTVAIAEALGFNCFSLLLENYYFTSSHAPNTSVMELIRATDIYTMLKPHCLHWEGHAERWPLTKMPSLLVFAGQAMILSFALYQHKCNSVFFTELVTLVLLLNNYCISSQEILHAKMQA